MEKIPTILLVVAGALRDQSGGWLMHRRPAGKHHAGLWEFPGGKVDADETPEIALIRELEEELRIVVDQADLVPTAFATEHSAAPERPIVILLYTCERWCGEPEPTEGGTIEWFTFDEMQALAKPPLDQDLLAALRENNRAAKNPAA